MLRKEIQNKTGLTRKALEYYEDRGIIKPEKSTNGYRNYRKKDLEILIKVSLFRKLGFKINEIEKIISSDERFLSSILRKKEYQLKIEEKRKDILKMIINKEKKKL